MKPGSSGIFPFKIWDFIKTQILNRKNSFDDLLT